MVGDDRVLPGGDPRLQVVQEGRIGTEAARRIWYGKFDDDGRVTVAIEDRIRVEEVNRAAERSFVRAFSGAEPLRGSEPTLGADLRL
jgi:hypothetical protein